MSERAKTVRELLASMEKHDVAAHKEVTKDEPEAAARNDGFWMGVTMAHSKLDPILDALIGAQGRVVYTGESLLAAGHAYEDAHRAALDMNDYEAGLLAGARAAITTAGGVVVDRIGYVSKEGSIVCRDREGRHDVLPLLKGDTLYVVRAKKE